MKNFIRTIFYGNLFYGFCTVVLSIESSLQHKVSLNSIRFYVLVFLATVIFYGRIYYRSSQVINVDDRTNWYRQNRPAIRTALIIATIICIADILLMAFINRYVFYHFSIYHWSLLFIVPLIGFMYTFDILPLKKLRRIGWLKPFVIGFVWAGVVTIFPVMFWQVQHPTDTFPGIMIKTFIWLQNFVFISVLAIIFDIKDYALDKKHQLKTYPATLGIPKTITYIVTPLTALGFAIMIAANAQKHLLQILPMALPYLILLLLINKSFNRGRSLLFYLVVIDGLMLLKGICGIISITCFN